MSNFDITKVKKLTRSEIENGRQPQVTLEGIKSMCNLLDEENPATYEIFLKYRPDLAESEVEFYKQIIATLKENIALKKQVIDERYKSFEECNINSPVQIITDYRLNKIDNPC
jgi:hypothetical protein